METENVSSDKTNDGGSNAVANNLSTDKINRASAFQSAVIQYESAQLKKLQRSISNDVATKAASKSQRTVQQQSALHANTKNAQPIQLFQDITEAQEKGRLFRQLSNREYSENRRITNLLQAFQSNPTEGNHELMMEDIESVRQIIKEAHSIMVEIIEEYEATEDNEQQMAYFEAYLEDKPFYDLPGAITQNEIAALFNSIMHKTEVGSDRFGEATPKERNRFLMFMMQGLRDDIGLEQYQALDLNLGENRKLIVGQVGPNNMSGGLENYGRDNDFSKKTDDGEVALDDQDFTTGGGTGIGFLRSKFSRPYDRAPNPERDQIGNMQINMDRNDELMPIFPGMVGDKMKLFSAPKKMAVHHEIGHVNSMLEGVSGSGKFMDGVARNLTDQEEMYNIWGGPRSDRAYGSELNLPERFSHGETLVTYFGPKNEGGGGGEYDDFMRMLELTDEFLSPVTSLGIEIKRLCDSNWKKITKGIYSRPDGVKAIRAIVNLNPKNPDLAAIRELAIINRDKGLSNNRHPFTLDFYTALADIDPDDRTSLSNVFRTLRTMDVPQQWE